MTRKPYSIYKNSGVEYVGKVPNTWKLYKLKYLLSSLESGKRESIKSPPLNEGAFSIGGEHINWDGTLNLENKRFLSFEYYSSMNKGKIEENDVLLVKDGATIGKAVIIIQKPYEKMAVNEHVFILRPNNKLSPKLLYYLIQSHSGLVQIKLTENGSAQPGINTEFTDKVLFAIPEDNEEQNNITKFLDSKTIEIRHIIEREKKLIELLKEKRSSFIDNLVTKGDEHLPLKDSGTDWLGEIPQNWRVLRSKLVFREVNDRSKSGDEELLTVSHITGVTPRSEKDVGMFLAETLENYKKCKSGDLVINTMWAWMGALGFAKKEGIVSPSYNVYRFRSSGFNPLYYDRLFRTDRFKTEIKRYSKGVWTSRLRLYPEEFFQIKIPIPPEKEQNIITDHLNRGVRDINNLIKKIQESIKKMSEYYSSLVFATVTGKIDITKEVAL